MWGEQLARVEHRVHDHRELARKGHGRSLEAEPFLQLQRPSPQPTRVCRPVQHDCGRLVEQTAQPIVTTTRM